ncbi:MAG: NADH-quinone oxidoreductase subunit L [Gemmataceae bacterium]|nr:NADH-quinone oxidoreductase subunit L [Gemmataceae bacterium]
MEHLQHHPGLLYVVATLLPLASFLILLLAGGLRAAVRPCRESNGTCGAIYGMLGGDTPRKTGAYIATVAIGLAFVCCLIGFIWHAKDTHHAHDAHAPAASAQGGHGVNKALHTEEHRWAGRMTWAAIGWTESDLQKPGSKLEIGYKIDNLSSIMFLMVTFIATLIHLFSIGYMADELQPITEDHHVHTEDGHLHRRGRFGRFFMYLSLFCFSMLNLILADNLFQVFVSWELVGICSYLLIGFYYERQSASNAANKAFITNRVGDAGFIIGLLIVWTYIGSLNFDDVFRQVRAPKDSHGRPVPLTGQVVRGEPKLTDEKMPGLEVTPGGYDVLLFRKAPPPGSHYHPPEIEEVLPVDASPEWYEKNPEEHQYSTMPYWLLVVAGLGIFLGCVGKSAQFPLQVWLPDAMEGPTPVSALIHAATMVAAGVYLVGRIYPLLTWDSRLVIAYTGAITLFVAATVAIVMTDIKKVLAYSTVSQLGYMMLALGVGGWAAGLFHLLTHAFFKALLFLGSGSVIYGCHHEQEMPKMGGLFKKMPITAITMLIGVLTIAGTPLFSGWYSKDAVIAHTFGFAYVHPRHGILFLLPLITAGITTFYMFRMWFLTFTGKPRDHHVHEHAHESPRLMTIPLILLAICSVGVAWGWPVWDAEASALEAHVHHAQHHAVVADFGAMLNDTALPAGKNEDTERYWSQKLHGSAGMLALLAAGLGFVFAFLTYKSNVLDPADAKAQFPAVHRFLHHKWYFDEAYSVLLVRPALAVAGWCSAFDARVIDGFVNRFASFSVWIANGYGKFDNGIVDGLVNVIGNTTYRTGTWLRHVQTGYLRSYVLFLVLALIGLYVLLSYFVSLASLG